ncbi:hypothetical protein TVAG_318910 [Trichomonas vaginalis G3]|uniref:receptor protein-tyrosine kinase n=1 Tax=Trichomonas vaginalis (strain ATCC PRA-98 / G3) TaxID=412133 RepID=A2EP69_TRIV3|nr:glycine-rich protein family [Trichomonas vaginalis G3]EAY05536.1 hypothetical protein TVAG_318910 [Trichomonas vaginalis G3]KAI5549095.1 glycine-rich protein family [Trichomonas vaginalis G3]|eukprot:XP_001317759.1 hypothetical protein [Trichomonas vaginalis G3]
MAIKYKLSKESIGSLNVTETENQYTFGYPCNDSIYDCTPYTVDLSSGTYLIEAWGSVGSFQHHQAGDSIPGLGGYSSGVLKVKNPLTLYLYIGSISFFNSMFSYTSKGNYFFAIGGGSSDVRLNASKTFDWSDPISLRSRILIAGGGGGSEWHNSIGGNGGGLEGGKGFSNCSLNYEPCPNSISGGGTQRSGGSSAPNFRTLIGYQGSFGVSYVNYNSDDMGGIGGNGYFSGGSVDRAGAGGGGSSFISGYDGCIALNSSLNENPSPINSSIHYSGIKFINPVMIQGNNTMPLFFKSETSIRGIGNNNRGAIRITIVSLKKCTENSMCQIYFPFLFTIFPCLI